MPQFTGQFLDTIGIEMESCYLSQRKVQDFLCQKLYRKYGREGILNVVRDASVESIYENLMVGGRRNLPVYSHTTALNRIRQIRSREDSRATMGYEIVINPIEISELEKLLFFITNSLVENGDYVSERASTHFHIGFVNNLRMMKNLLLVCLQIDPLLYRLGGMGGIYRGFLNGSAYARPLLNSCVVPIAKSSQERSRIQENSLVNGELVNEDEDVGESSTEVTGKYAKIINPERAMYSTNIQQFWACFGVDYESRNGLPKYHPSRYTGCNFYSIPAHGTIEFRHFNQSFDYKLITAIAKFLRATVEMSTLLNKNDVFRFSVQDSNTQISMQEADSTMQLLLGFFREKEIENLPTSDEINLIMKTIEQSSFKDIPKMPVKTHIRDFHIGPNIVKFGDLLTVSRASNPTATDIHNIEDYPLLTE
jgi:hypothetical protein